MLNGVLHWRLQSRVLRGCAWSLGRSPPAFLGPGSPLVKQLRTQNDVKALSTLTIPPMEGIVVVFWIFFSFFSLFFKSVLDFLRETVSVYVSEFLFLYWFINQSNSMILHAGWDPGIEKGH